MKRWLILLLLPLSGCFGAPDIPDDAVIGTDGDIKLSSWTEMRGGRIQFHAVAENLSGNDLQIRSGCGEPWDSVLTGPNGQVDYVEVQESPGCPVYLDVLRSGGYMEFLHSWDFQGHEPETGESWTLPGGEYLWRLQFWLRDDLTFVETRIPIDVACSSKNPCQAEPVVTAAFEQSGNTWYLNATATHDGPGPYKISSICAPAWTDTMTSRGDPIQHREPMAVCAAYGVRDWMPNETLWFNTTWDGKTWTCYEECASTRHIAEYEWTAVLRTLEPSREFTASVAFTIDN